MENRLRKKEFDCVSSVRMIDSFIFLLKAGELDMNPPYQRELVWKTSHKIAFIEYLISGMPIGDFAVATIDTDTQYMVELVDGKQRINAILSFMNDEFGIHIDDELVYFSEMNISEQRKFRNIPLPVTELLHANDLIVRVRYFYKINFGGVPQSEEHRLMVENMLISLN